MAVVVELTPAFLSRQLEKLDLTNTEAAAHAGVGDSTVYRWLNGSSPIPRAPIVMFELMCMMKDTALLFNEALVPPARERRGEDEADDQGPVE